MHTALKSVKFPFERVLPQCCSIIRNQDMNICKENSENSCFEKNTFACARRYILHSHHELKLPSKSGTTNAADLSDSLCVIQVVFEVY